MIFDAPDPGDVLRDHDHGATRLLRPDVTPKMDFAIANDDVRLGGRQSPALVAHLLLERGLNVAILWRARGRQSLLATRQRLDEGGPAHDADQLAVRDNWHALDMA